MVNMRTNADLTIYNRYIVSGDAVYIRFVLYGVAWQNVRAVNQLKSGGNIAANKVTVYIPELRGGSYLEPKAWLALATKTGKWTLKEGDYLVRGAVADDIATSFTVTDLKAKYDDVLAISSVDPHLYGSLSMQHWEVGAK